MNVIHIARALFAVTKLKIEKIGSVVHFAYNLTTHTSVSAFQILTVSATPSRDIFRAAQVSMGLLSVIMEVTFQCKPEFNLKETIAMHSTI